MEAKPQRLVGSGVTFAESAAVLTFMLKLHGTDVSVCAMDNSTTSMVFPASLLPPEITCIFLNLVRYTLQPHDGWSAICNLFYRIFFFMTQHFSNDSTILFRSWYDNCTISVSGMTWQLVLHSITSSTIFPHGRCCICHSVVYTTLYYSTLKIPVTFLFWSLSQQPVITCSILK